MMCVHCKKAVFYEEKDYAKVVTEEGTKFFHGKCFWEIFDRKEVIPSSNPQNRDSES